jgi:molybdopterin synthase catalytic subunit
VLALEYEAYEPMVEKVGQRLLAEAAERFEVVHLAAAHRVGRLAVGEAAVIIVASAAHRDAAFQACRYVIDRIKHEAPIWKKEYHPDGAEWVLCSHGHAPAEVAEA